MMTFGKKLLDILVCPQCRGSLDPEYKKDALLCPVCGLLYEIRNGIPILLIDQAIRLHYDQADDSRRIS